MMMMMVMVQRPLARSAAEKLVDASRGGKLEGRTDDLVWHVVVAWRSKIWFCRSPGTERSGTYSTAAPIVPTAAAVGRLATEREFDTDKKRPDQNIVNRNFSWCPICGYVHVAHTRRFYVCEWRFCAFHTDDPSTFGHKLRAVVKRAFSGNVLYCVFLALRSLSHPDRLLLSGSAYRRQKAA